ncbi:hypothetical protein CBS101457_004077 [Exobasidium rhododendri]|nr:hypothetical protein CBS101457_004077 [Exobasidium rhododendri]
MHFKDIRLSRRGSFEVSSGSRPSTPGEGKNGRRGRSSYRSPDSPSMNDGPVEAELSGRQPKRSNSFGLGLGGLQSLANGMSRAGESFSRKQAGQASSDGTKTPPMIHSGAATASNVIPMGPPTLPDSSHLAQFSLKLSDLVNKSFVPCTGVALPSTPSSGVLAGAAKNAAAMTSVGGASAIPALSTIQYEGKKLPSKAMVVDIAKTVVRELEYSSAVDPYLLRAVSRSALKALTLFANRIDSLLVPPSKDSSVAFVPSTSKEGVHLPASLEFNLGLVTLEWIVEDALERCIEGPPGSQNEGMPHFVSEILTPVRKKMEGTILHVIQPLISSVKTSFTQCLLKAVPKPFSSFELGLSPVTSITSPLIEAGPLASSGILTPASTSSSSAAAASSSSWLRELEGRLEGNRRLLIPRIEERCGQDGEGWFISVAIHVIWKGLFILTSRTMPMSSNWTSSHPVVAPTTVSHLMAADASKRSPSPAQLTNALKSVSVKPRKLSGAETPSGLATPSHVSILTASAKATIHQVQELQAFEKLILKFATGFQPSHAKSTTTTATSSSSQVGRENSDTSDEEDDDDDDEDELARAALAEALQAIKSTILVVQYLETHPEATLEAIMSHKDRSHTCVLPIEVIRAVKAIPHLLLLHLVYARMPTHLASFASVIAEGGHRSEAIIPSPPGVFGYTWMEYERAIAGFAGGQSWAYALVDAWKEDIREANESLDVRSKAVMKQKVDKEVHQDLIKANSNDAHHENGDGASTQEEITLRRTASTRSTSDSSDSIPENMTASAPTLDREKAKVVAVTSHPSSLTKPSTWSTLRLSKRGTSRMNEVEIDHRGAPPSPDESPPRSPYTGPVGPSTSRSGETSTTKTKRFWKAAQSSQSQFNGGFHLTNVGRARATSPSSKHTSHATTQTSGITEEERIQEEIRLERKGIQLLERAIYVVEGIRKPAPGT